MSLQPEPVELTPIPKLAPLYTMLGLGGDVDLTAGYEYIRIKGGRGGGKSESVAEVLVLISRIRKTRILCTREIQTSMADSVYKMLEEWIIKHGFRNEFHLTKNSIINKYTGTDFIFKGMEYAVRSDSLKSLKDVEIVWYEEAQTATEKSLKKLTPTIRINSRKLIFTFNQITAQDPVITFFDKKKRVLDIKINYYENQYCPQVLLDEAEEDKELDFEDYKHTWLGEPISEDGSQIVLFMSKLVQCVDLHKRFDLGPFRKVGGFDIADGKLEKHDTNSLAVREGPIVSHVEEWRCDEVYQSVQKINSRYNFLGFENLYFDATGLGVAGKSEFSRLNSTKREKLKYGVIPFLGGENPMGKDKVFVSHDKHKITNGMMFLNIKAQAWWNLRLRLDNSMRLIKGRKIDRPDYFLSFSSEIPGLESIFLELSQATWEETTAGKIKIDKSPGEKTKLIEGKNKIRKSPNKGDSVKMSFAGDLRGGLRAHKATPQKMKAV